MDVQNNEEGYDPLLNEVYEHLESWSHTHIRCMDVQNNDHDYDNLQTNKVYECSYRLGVWKLRVMIMIMILYVQIICMDIQNNDHDHDSVQIY